MVKIGQKVQFRPELYFHKKQVVGRVVYIHPKRRWARVEWSGVNYMGQPYTHCECLQIINEELRVWQLARPEGKTR